MDNRDIGTMDERGMRFYLQSYEEAVEILTDIFNGDYTIKAFRNDVLANFTPDDRGDINR
tara:strand:- start:522 stop:701 length:180 start_codon:yes stop_codon:yes gene_type:complete